MVNCSSSGSLMREGSVDLTAEIAEAMGAVVVRHIRDMGYSVHDISDSVLTIGVGMGNV